MSDKDFKEQDDTLIPFKVVVFGTGGVGKSSLTLRFVTDTFTSDYLPTIEDCYRKQFLVDDICASLDILDTAGQEEYISLRDSWVREGRAFCLVFSLTSKSSFKEISNFRERILLVNEEEVTPMVLVGNKADLVDQRVIEKEDALQLAKEFGDIPYLECSALTGENCSEVFAETVREIRKLTEQTDKNDDGDNDVEKKKKSWCTLL